MPRRTAWLHIGLPGTGAPAVAAALASYADSAAAQGFSLPALSEEQLLRAALELRREHKAWGYRRREVEGAWAEVCRRAHKGRREPVVVCDLLAACSPEQVALLLDGLAPMRTHVVVSLRDPLSQVLDAWAQTVRLGRAVPFATYAERLLDPARGHVQAERFWAAQDVGAVLDRWSRAVGAERVHVAVLPPHADPAPAAWAALAGVIGLDVSALPRPGDGATRGAPDASGVAAGARVDGSRRPGLPRELHDTLDQLSRAWRDRVLAGGHPVHGDPDDLVPGPGDPHRLPPDPAPAEARLATAGAALADVLVEVARLRRHNAALQERTASLSATARRPRRPCAR